MEVGGSRVILEGGEIMRSPMDNKVSSQMNILNENSSYFLRSKMFRLLRTVTENSVNTSNILKLHNFCYGRPLRLLAPGAKKKKP